MKKFLILTALIISSVQAKSQTTQIILKKVIGKSHLMYEAPPSEDTINRFSIPNNLRFKHLNYYTVNIAPIEERFRRFKKGEISYDQFVGEVKGFTRNSIDTSDLSANIRRFDSGKTYIASGVDFENNRIFIVDANHDHKISPKEIITYKRQFIDNLRENSRFKKALLPTLLSQKGKNGSFRTLSLKFVPLPYFDRYSSDEKKQTSFSILRNEEWSATKIIANKLFTFIAESKQFTNEANDLDFIIKCDTSVNRFPIDLKQEWSNSQFSLTVDSVSKINTTDIKLFISYQSPPKSHNDTTFSMELPNVKTNIHEKLGSYLDKQKYLLLDYWGTWCTPCIELIPKLKMLNEKFAKRLNIVSIAYDANIEKVKEFDEKSNNNWNSYFLDRTSRGNLIKYLKVIAFPTFRLYDSSGKLVYHGSTKEDLENIAKILFEASR